MDRRTLQSAVVAGAGILAVAFAAATLSSTVQTSTGGGSDSTGSGGGGGGMRPPPTEEPPTIPLPDIPYLEEALLALLVIALLATLIYLVIYWREVVAVVVGVALALGLVIFVAQFLFNSVDEGMGGFPAPGSGVFGPKSAGGGSVPTLPSALLVLLVILGIVGVGVALIGTNREDESDDTESRETPTGAADVGRAAGEAADRLEADDNAGTLGNEIYRAWREMTELLDVPNPDATTTGEFEAAAVESGMTPADVRELTRLFEDVRYGDHDPTDADEQRAIRVFRRIENAYARGDS